MTTGPLPEDALTQFASTFREWHYLLGGFAAGVLVGIEYYRRAIDD